MGRSVAALLAIVGACVVSTACSHVEGKSQADPTSSPPPPVVIVSTVHTATIPVTNDYQGTIGAIESVEVRARVEGTLDSAPFKEGSLVRKGQLLFVIQQNQYQAAVQSAQAQLATARAQVSQARGNVAAKQAALNRAVTTVQRDTPLAAAQAIPQKDLDNAIETQAFARGELDVARAQIQSAEAAVQAAQAAVTNAGINYGYTTVHSPVTGLIGFRKFDVGNVVGGPNAQVLDTITVMDPIKVNFAIDEATYLALSKNRGNSQVGALADQELPLILANNSTYEYRGKLYTVNPTVDPKTGTINIEARFPNPDGLLRPGGFARIRVLVERLSGAVLVPKTAIVQTQGVDTAYVVDANDVIALRTVSLGQTYQQSYVVKSGLAAGDRVVIEGTQKVRPGMKVAAQTR
jgi:membrane fusion protein (multidrug efflux system)